MFRRTVDPQKEATQAREYNQVIALCVSNNNNNNDAKEEARSFLPQAQ